MIDLSSPDCTRLVGRADQLIRPKEPLDEVLRCVPEERVWCHRYRIRSYRRRNLGCDHHRREECWHKPECDIYQRPERAQISSIHITASGPRFGWGLFVLGG